jgi:large subunit ribosomal protein L31e
MADEKIYTIPLRREWLKVPIYKRSRKAITATKQFLLKHLKKEVKLGPYLNEFIWDKGNRHPPGKVKVRVEEEGERTIAELITAPKKEVKKEEKKDSISIKKPKFLQKDKKEEKAEEKESIDKKAIEKVPVDKAKESEEKKEVKPADVKEASPKKEKVIATEKAGQLRK